MFDELLCDCQAESSIPTRNQDAFPFQILRFIEAVDLEHSFVAYSSEDVRDKAMFSMLSIVRKSP